ncbi:ANTAR domain-containing protein [uncultured Sphaerochaeta sp.]|uniref:ANTAR domain-containing response regulator n=1 Tax=uncultured Sphaerochaeta sp. TaxID=886478 RepID=UPI0029C79F1F|nr:ANTAR domain-containing protein [uncultured Sphaerochaeta sp.]
MLRALVVSSTQKGCDSLCSLMREHDRSIELLHCLSAGEARRLVLDQELDLVVINAPLLDESGEELAVMVVQQSLAGSILVVRNQYFEQCEALFSEQGVLVVSKPVIRQMFFQALSLARSMRRRLTAMHTENEKLHKKIEEIKIIDKAKWVLIENLGMDEQQAHRYMEKQAMDLRKSRYAVALSLLKTYQM